MVRSAKRKKVVSERRAAPRANRVIAIRHRLFKRSSKKTEASWSLSTTKNMSVTGLLFLSKMPYKMGDVIEVAVTMSGIIDIVKGHAQVVRVAESRSGMYEVAVHLVEVKPKARSAKSHI